jgi:hypothetical protein
MQKYLSILIIHENKNIFKKIFLLVNDKLYEISVDLFGTRFFQKTLEKLDNGVYYKIETFELDKIFENLIKNHLYELCCDKNGNHVYQKLIKLFPKEKNNFLFEYLTNIAVKVALLQQGATILQVAFDYGTPEQTEKLCIKLIDNINLLINHKYGNYTIQSIIKLNILKINDIIYKYITDNLVSLSKEKFSSNVIDKCIKKNNFYSNKLINEIINKNLIKEILSDQYGNYVIQKSLSVTEGSNQFKLLINQIKPILFNLKNSNIGKKIYEKLTQQYQKYFI